MITTIRTVMLKELRESFRDRRTLVNSLLIGPMLAPLFFILVLKLALSRSVAGQDEAAPVTVVNAAAAPNLVQQLREGGLVVTLREGTEAEIRGWIAEENELVVLRIPDGFGERFTGGEPAPVQVFADGSDSKAGKHSARLSAAIAGYAARVASLRLQARGISPMVVQPIVIDDIDVSTPSARAMLLLGMLSYVILLATLMGGLYLAIDATAGERERGSLESLLTVPAVRDHLIYGKIAATAVMMLVALAFVVASIAVSLQAVPLETFGMSANFGPGVMWGVFLAVAPFALVAAALLTVVASFTRTYKEAQSWLGIVLLVPTVPIAIASVLAIAPQAPLMLVPSLSQHLLIQGLIRGEPLPTAWFVLAAASCLALGAALAWLAGRLYRREAILG
ncbi:MAG TPA: ABC transporter permease [Kofleriaceae bacterium]